VADANIPELSHRMRALLTEMEQKLAALNMVKINADVEQLLSHLNRVIVDANVPALSREAQGLIAELRSTNQCLRDLLAPTDDAAPRANLPEVVCRLSQTLSQLNKMLATERPEIQTILAELREAMDNLNDLIMNLSERPSELLFSRPPRESEVLK